jgi:hypothetical protein
VTLVVSCISCCLTSLRRRTFVSAIFYCCIKIIQISFPAPLKTSYFKIQELCAREFIIQHWPENSFPWRILFPHYFCVIEFHTYYLDKFHFYFLVSRPLRITCNLFYGSVTRYEMLSYQENKINREHSTPIVYYLPKKFLCKWPPSQIAEIWLEAYKSIRPCIEY